MLLFEVLPDAGKAAKMDHKMEPKRDRKRVAKGTRNGTETEIMINKNNDERKRLEDSGLFWGVKVEERDLEAELELELDPEPRSRSLRETSRRETSRPQPRTPR